MFCCVTSHPKWFQLFQPIVGADSGATGVPAAADAVAAPKPMGTPAGTPTSRTSPPNAKMIDLAFLVRFIN